MKDSTPDSESAAKPLETEFTKGGVKYTQIRREGNLAIYHRESEDFEWEDWEVVKIRSQKASSWEAEDGQKVIREAKELYPSDNSWGISAWTFNEEKDANRKFELVQEWAKKHVHDGLEGVLSSKTGQDSTQHVSEDTGGQEP